MIIIDSIDKALEIILKQKPLVIFQGESEWGPRALGNRSILFDPRNKDAKNIVNNFKKRVNIIDATRRLLFIYSVSLFVNIYLLID
jgi:hypothetical protein